MFIQSCQTCANREICNYCDQTDYDCSNWIGEIELQTVRAPERCIQNALSIKTSDFEQGIDSVATQLISNTTNQTLDILTKFLHSYPMHERPIVIAAMRYIANEQYSVISDDEKAFVDAVGDGIQTIRFDFSGFGIR